MSGPSCAARSESPRRTTTRTGFSDAEEGLLGTNAQLPDTDGDGLIDGMEMRLGTNPKEQDNPKGNQDWWEVDSDGDGDVDQSEFQIGSDPLDPDTDDDGRRDGDDFNPTGWDPPGTNDDWDGDGIANRHEAFLGLNVMNSRDAPLARPTVESRYVADELANADMRVLAGVEALPEEQVRFEAAVAEALASDDVLVRNRAYVVLQNVTGQTPPSEHLKAMEEFFDRAQQEARQRLADAVDNGDMMTVLVALRGSAVIDSSYDPLSELEDDEPAKPAESSGSNQPSSSSGRYVEEGFKLILWHQSSNDGSTYTITSWVAPDKRTTVTELTETNQDGSSTTSTEVRDETGEVIYSSRTVTDPAGNTTTTSTSHTEASTTPLDPCAQTACPDPVDPILQESRELGPVQDPTDPEPIIRQP